MFTFLRSNREPQQQEQQDGERGGVSSGGEGGDNTSGVRVVAVVRIVPLVGGYVSRSSPTEWLDDLIDLRGTPLLLELVSVELDPETGLKKAISKYARRRVTDRVVTYEATFKLPPDFGEVGAVLVKNEHHREMYLNEIVLNGLHPGPVRFTCESWLDPSTPLLEERIFFTNKSYLPSQTPPGLEGLRQRELSNLRGDGEGERNVIDRIYEYDTYNDLGDPDQHPDLARPVLGGQHLPYPRRCRTGRPRCTIDPSSETRSKFVYVPRNEQFSKVKQDNFSTKTLHAVVESIIPSIETVLYETQRRFQHIADIDSLFNREINVPDLNPHGIFSSLLPRLVKAIHNIEAHLLQFETPAAFDRDPFSWLSDEEFSRQTLAGLNPCVIQLVKEWPLTSNLDQMIYGPKESEITTELIEREILGYMTFEEAREKNKLFMVDYHDTFLPYVSKVRELEGRTLYGSRTLFILSEDQTLRPLAIELTRPPYDDKPQWKKAFTPKWDATSTWLWRLAKAHALANDAGYHQLISHWLRTHCCTEPYIIALKRQMSAMHPIFRLLHPHFRYTMEINALARLSLINAGGIIESTFSPGKYSLEMSSVIYRQEWRFDQEALPADLIRRGMAVEDATALHGLKLHIEDYPYANDGLMLWDIIKEWVTDYVNYYYPESTLVKLDSELQQWWEEIRRVGHGDKKGADWWPNLDTTQDLIGIITTMVWVTSGHHAAVNFGQYDYGGYIPNRPTLTRTKMPTEDPIGEEWESFSERPEETLLNCFPSQVQTTTVMVVLDVLSSHSPEEEYIGQNMEPAFGEDVEIRDAFERFRERLLGFTNTINDLNGNRDLKNRNGVGVVPYELLKPVSGPGVTSMGVPNSISI